MSKQHDKELSFEEMQAMLEQLKANNVEMQKEMERIRANNQCPESFGEFLAIGLVGKKGA
jgi:hypothetical protein